SPSHPLLEFGRQSLLQHGWTVQQVWWDAPRGRSDHQIIEWVGEQARAAVDAERRADVPAERILLMGKSLGTLASPVAAGLPCPAVWFTPLCDVAACLAGIGDAADAGADQLLVGGLADSSWNAQLARALGADRPVSEVPRTSGDQPQTRTRGVVEVVDFADATHLLHVPGDAVRSAEIQYDITRAVDRFLSRLG
ncbi:MAG: hypothetical protein ACRDOD_17260, partial [Streptosporangiaceae bacterium]